MVTARCRGSAAEFWRRRDRRPSGRRGSSVYAAAFLAGNRPNFPHLGHVGHCTISRFLGQWPCFSSGSSYPSAVGLPWPQGASQSRRNFTSNASSPKLRVHAESARWPLGYESYHPAARGPGLAPDREGTLPLGPPMTDQRPTLRKSVSRSAAGPRAGANTKRWPVSRE